MSRPNSNQRQQFLQRMVQEKERRLSKAPEGSLRVVPIRGKQRHYHMLSSNSKTGTYLSKKDLPLAKALAQKSYDRKVLRFAEQELKAWELLAKHFPDMTVEEVYATLSPARQRLVTPIHPTDEQYRKQWESVPYESGYFKPDTPQYLTDRGERVRSKSEQLIANMLYRLDIPYRYEYPTKVIVNGETRTWRPDFLLLDVKNRKEFYLEHFGLLGDADYTRIFIGKMLVYEENGMREGVNMIYSYESDAMPLDIKHLERKVCHALGI